MASNFIAPGSTVDYANGGTARTSGQAILIGTRLGICKDAIPANTTGVLHVEGVWSVTKLFSDAVTQFQALYWDNTNFHLTTTVGSNTLVGEAWAATGSTAADTTVAIKLRG